MEINKKAVFFSLTSLIVVSVLLVTVQADANRRSNDFVRVQLQDFQADVDKLVNNQLPEVLVEYTRRSLDAVARENIERLQLSATTQEYEEQFAKCVVTNTQESTCASEEQNFHLLLTDIQEAMKRQQYNSSIQLTDVQISQNGAWELVIEGTFDIYVEKDTNTIRTRKQVDVVASTPIVGLIDPVSSVQRGEIQRIKRPFQTNNESLEFLEHARTKTYVQIDGAPSYLERLTGQQGPAAQENFGIGSLIVLPFEDRTTMYSVDYGDRDIEAEDCAYIFDISEQETSSRYISISDNQFQQYIQKGYVFNELLTDDRSTSINCDEDRTTG